MLEAIVEKGRHLGKDAAHLPNLAALLRAKKKIQIGLPILEWYEAPYNAWFSGKVSRVSNNKWQVKYDADDSVSEITDINVLRNMIDVLKLPQWQENVAKVKVGFEYLEKRLTDQCASPYHCEKQHKALGLLRAFNPAFAQAQVDEAFVRDVTALP
eukprot:scaffold309665_cov39-Tisochrysis_lutea.AAC.1